MGLTQAAQAQAQLSWWLPVVNGGGGRVANSADFLILLLILLSTNFVRWFGFIHVIPPWWQQWPGIWFQALVIPVDGLMGQRALCADR